MMAHKDITLIVSEPRKSLGSAKDVAQTAVASTQMAARVLNIFSCVLGETDRYLNAAMEQHYNIPESASKTGYS